MADAIGAGDGGPPAPPTQGQTAVTAAPAQQQAEGNVSVLDYARRKLREREQTTKPAEGQANGEPQKQPSPPKAAPETRPVLSQAAESATQRPGQVPAPAAARAPEAQEEPAPADQAETEVPQESVPAEETEGAPDGDDALPDDAPEWMQKRIARFTRQKHELQNQVEAMRAELAQAKGVNQPLAQSAPEPPLPVVVVKDDPAGHLVNEGQIDQAFDQARELRRWCMRNPEGGTFQVADGKGGVTEREFNAQQVTALREAAEDDIEKHLPRRREYLRQERTFTTDAVKAHPWLTDPKSPRVGIVRQLLADYPQIRLRPDWAQAAAIFARGLEVVQREQSEAVRAVTPPRPKPGPPPPKIPGPSPTAPRKQGPTGVADAELKAAEEAWALEPSSKNFARLHRARRQQTQRQQ